MLFERPGARAARPTSVAAYRASVDRPEFVNRAGPPENQRSGPERAFRRLAEAWRGV